MDTVTTLVDMKPVIEVLVQCLAGLAMAFGTYMVHKIAQKFKLEADDKVRGYLLAAVENAVNYGQHKADEIIKEKGIGSVDVKNETVAFAAKYLMTKVPDAVGKFKLSEDDVKDLVLAKLEKPASAGN